MRESVSKAFHLEQSIESRSYEEIRLDRIAIDDRFISSDASGANLYFSLFFSKLRESASQGSALSSLNFGV